MIEAKDSAPIIDASALRMPSADFWPIDNHQGTVEVGSVNWYAAAWLAYSCMRYRATKLIEPPLWVTEEKSGEESFIQGGHPIEELLQRPNPDMSLSDLLELTSLYLDTTPGCVWHKVRDRGQRVARLYPYSGDEFTVESAPDDEGLPRIYGKYRLRLDGGRQLDVGPDDVIHFRNANPANLHRSLPPLSAALARLGIERSLIEATRAGLRNSIRPGSSIKFDGTFTDQQKVEFKQSLREQYEQARNHGKTLVVGNATYAQHEMGFKGLGGGELSMQNEAAICAVFQVPAVVVGARVGLENSSDRHNMETAVDLFYDVMAFPTWTRWEDTITVSLLREFDTNPRHFIRFDKTRVRALKDDITEKATTVAALRQELDLDERRALLGYPKATPQQREEIEAANQAAPSPFAEEPVKSRRPVQTKVSPRETLWKLRDAAVRGQELAWELGAGRQLRKDRAAVLELADEILKPAKAAARGLETKEPPPPFGADPESIRRLIAALSEKLDLEKAWAPITKDLTNGTAKRAVRDVASELDLSFDVLQPGLTKYVTDHAAELVKGISATTRSALTDTLNQALEAGEGIPAITKRIEESGAFAPSRAELIARTETTTVTNQAGRESLSNWAAENDAKVVKGWLATQDSRTREEHAAMDGEEVDIDAVFSNGLLAPGEPNCRCSMTYRIVEA